MKVQTFLFALMASALAGCASSGPPPDTFDLSGATALEGRQSTRRQILVSEPSALKALDSDQIVVRTSPSAIQYLSGSQWNDRLPRIVQSRLIQAFEDTGRVAGVGKPGDGLSIDYNIITTIRAFEVRTAGADVAMVDLSVKLLDDRTGKVRAQKVFRASQPVGGSGNTAFVAALDRAFADVSGDIITWTLSRI